MTEEGGKALERAPGAAKIRPLELEREARSQFPERSEIGLDEPGQPRAGETGLPQGPEEKLQAFAQGPRGRDGLRLGRGSPERKAGRGAGGTGGRAGGFRWVCVHGGAEGKRKHSRRA